MGCEMVESQDGLLRRNRELQIRPWVAKPTAPGADGGGREGVGLTRKAR